MIAISLAITILLNANFDADLCVTISGPWARSQDENKGILNSLLSVQGKIGVDQDWLDRSVHREIV